MRIIASIFLVCAVSFLAPLAASAVTIAWSPVGNPGNAPDPATGSLYGAVPYAYKIGTYDVTNAQYAEFLNTTDPTGANSLGLWNANMADPTHGGIDNSGTTNGNRYTLISGAQNHPVNFVTWYDAVRFANWLNNGQGNGDTETGAYTLGPLGADGVPINGPSITRNAHATVFLPSEDEWYSLGGSPPSPSSRTFAASAGA
jgi:sulfatase modifying factor 1